MPRGTLLALLLFIAAPLPAQPRYRVEESHTSFAVDGFKLDLRLPVVHGAPELARVVRSAMDRVRSEERSSLEEYCRERKADGERCEGETEWAFEVVFSDEHLLSILFPHFTSTRGAAHPSHGIDTFTFAVDPPRLLALTDLSTNPARFLRRLSNLARKKLPELDEVGDASDTDWIRRGTEPTARNFRAWTVTKDGLQIHFEEYQVAAYVAGPQVITIPYAEIRDLLRRTPKLPR